MQDFALMRMSRFINEYSVCILDKYSIFLSVLVLLDYPLLQIIRFLDYSNAQGAKSVQQPKHPPGIFEISGRYRMRQNWSFGLL